jgi:hypothetical protein
MIPTLEAVSALLTSLILLNLLSVLSAMPLTIGTLITKPARAALNIITLIAVLTNVFAAQLDIPLIQLP